MAVAASALSVFNVVTDVYGLAVVQAITNKLNKNKTTLSCGLSVGYDNDAIHDCLNSFVQNRNTLIQAADEHALEQYLVTTIPETVPGKRRGKKQLVKLLVLCWGGSEDLILRSYLLQLRRLLLNRLDQVDRDKHNRAAWIFFHPFK